MCIVEIMCNNCFTKHIVNSHNGSFYDEDGELLTEIEFCKYCV